MATSCTLLVVEDNLGDYMLIKKMLNRNSDWMMTRATTVAAALDVLGELEVDAVLLDLSLPDSVGLETLIRVRRQAETLPILILSGDDDEQNAVDAMIHGAQTYLVKGNIDGEGLTRAIRFAIERQNYRNLINLSSEGMVVLDNERCVRYANQRALAMLDTGFDTIVGSRFEFTPPLESTIQVSLPGADVEIRGVATRWEGRDATLISLQDVTAHRALQSKLRHDAMHDSLTGLPNREFFERALAAGFARARRREGNYTFGIAFIDLDGFKLINDGLGHGAGDAVLRTIGERMQAIVRPGDVVARFSGDEFLVFLDDQPQPERVLEAATKLMQAIREPVDIGGQPLVPAASIGVVTHHRGYESTGQMIRDADLAMYSAKERGGNRIVLYDDEMHSRALRRLELRRMLPLALEQDAFHMVYQPVVRIADQHVVGCEALLRWVDPAQGFITPGDFIPVAEESGLIVPLGEWILNSSCAQLAAWRRTPGLPSDVSIAVNISAIQLGERGFCELVDTLLTGLGLAPQMLALEITEGVYLAENVVVSENLFQLKELGVSLHLDDFGTGYSALSYLHRFPLDTLKIDRSFVSRLTCSEQSSVELVKAIIALAGSLGLDVIAEGVESAEELDILRELGCKHAQGYFFCRPIKALEFESYHAEHSMRKADRVLE